MMLPPIHKPSAGANELTKRRASATTDAPGASPYERGEPEHSNLTERLFALERENHVIREELAYLRQTLSNNHHHRDDDKGTLSKVSEDLQRVVHSFNAKAQADALTQQREQHKAALLFAEVARLGLSLGSLELTVRNLSDDTRRQFDQQTQQLTHVSTLSASRAMAPPSPTKRSHEENSRQTDEIQWLKHTLAQLRAELETDHTERWRVESERNQWASDLRAAVLKTESSMDARIATHLERVHSKLVTDKMEMVRALDEYRELVTGADFKRVSSQMIEFSRINDHLYGLERWLHGEHAKIKRVLQSIQTDCDSRLGAVVGECTMILKLLSSLVQQHDDDWQVHVGALHDAVAAMASHVQRKVYALEEVVPMEVKARQNHDEKLRQRVDRAVTSLARAIATTRDETLAAVAAVAVARPTESTVTHTDLTTTETMSNLQRRIEALEESHTQALKSVEEQLENVKASIVHDSRPVGIETAIVASGTPAQGVAVTTTTTTALATDEDASLPLWRDALEQRTSQLSLAFMDELTERSNDLLSKLEALETNQGDAIASLQRWSATHAHECRQCYEYVQWSLDQALTDAAVRQTVDRLVDTVAWMALETSTQP